MPNQCPIHGDECINIRLPSELKQKATDAAVRAAFEVRGASAVADAQATVVCLDMRSVRWVEVGSLLWLIPLLSKLRRQRNRLRLHLPDATDPSGLRVLHFLHRLRFFEALHECVDDPTSLLSEEQVSYLRLESKYFAWGADLDEKRQILLKPVEDQGLLAITTIRAEDTQAADSAFGRYLFKWRSDITLGVLCRLTGWPYKDAVAFTRDVVGEGLKNGVSHGGPSFACVALTHDGPNLLLSVADDGLGIPDTLRTAFRALPGDKQDLTSLPDSELITYFTKPDAILDSDWIRLAIKKGVSSDPTRQGIGLYYLRVFMARKQCQLRVRSGQAIVEFTRDAVTPLDGLMEAAGTLLRIVIPTSEPPHAR